jgi:hypothetical protein
LDAYPVEDGNEVERDARYGHILAVICGELCAVGRVASLVSPKYPPPLDLPVSDLERASPMLLASVGTIHFKPEWVTYMDVSSRVHIPAKVGDAAVARAIREVETGQWLTTQDAPPPPKANDGSRSRRAIKEAYWKRFPNGHEAERLYWPQVPHELGLPPNALDTVKRALGRKK